MSFFSVDFLGQPLWMWLGFLVFVLALLVMDLWLFSRGDQTVTVSKSLRLSCFYFAMSLAFAGFVWWRMGASAATLYLTGYVVEESLSLDNIFVIALIFGYFQIPPHLQRRALVFGIIGVVILRGLMIGLGTALVDRFHVVLYLFALFLVVSGIRMMFSGDDDYDIAANPVLRFLQKHLPIVPDLHGDRFFVRLPRQKDGASAKGKHIWYATPLFLALVMVELADVIFAVDSVPAIFSITTEPYLVFTSNIAAILGLRALYFALAAMMERFYLLKYALSAVLVFIGGKIIAVDMLGLGQVPPLASLVITLAILSAGVIASLSKTRSD
ncbi:TerC family protein [Allorhizobium sp. BGMRC 0089]|uniref:TerC family protein n=1 Tax=Allorhizobium sonneratiae TaxID=2934936 RepID=UPI002033D9A5|nr:TerC family protein [Allorhizobium sonneratiae]MCM2291305.1 TerC family protein [Allorhizobium sonneratiae]